MISQHITGPDFLEHSELEPEERWPILPAAASVRQTISPFGMLRRFGPVCKTRCVCELLGLLL
jgi:hypothetical protein